MKHVIPIVISKWSLTVWHFQTDKFKLSVSRKYPLELELICKSYIGRLVCSLLPSLRIPLLTIQADLFSAIACVNNFGFSWSVFQQPAILYDACSLLLYFLPDRISFLAGSLKWDLKSRSFTSHNRTGATRLRQLSVLCYLDGECPDIWNNYDKSNI